MGSDPDDPYGGDWGDLGGWPEDPLHSAEHPDPPWPQEPAQLPDPAWQPEPQPDEAATGDADADQPRSD